MGLVNRPLEDKVEESSQSDISEVLWSTIGATQRGIFDCMRRGILGPHTVPSDESLRTAVPRATLNDVPSRRPDPSIALDHAPPFRATIRRLVPRRLMRSPSPDWIRSRSVSLPEVSHTLHYGSHQSNCVLHKGGASWQCRNFPGPRQGVAIDLDHESMATETETETETGEAAYIPPLVEDSVK